MVYSCIGAEIEDSDSSSTCDFKELQHSADGSNIISDTPTDTRSNGHVVSSKHQTDRQMEMARQERIVPLTESRTEVGEDVQSSAIGSVAPCGPRPEPPPQSTKPKLQRDKTSPEKTKTSPQTLASPEKEQNIDQKSLPPSQPVSEEKETSEASSPTNSVKPGMEHTDPTIISHGIIMPPHVHGHR
ncbi:hypothetical protein XENOCAPTIV_020349 [Xenoophorus captivus]|uniref:Uncharacterized protein n=1 Tax=Xenoophorus captivus TaxID=1517983 RepID=A0ABV0SB37_9TELE